MTVVPFKCEHFYCICLFSVIFSVNVHEEELISLSFSCEHLCFTASSVFRIIIVGTVVLSGLVVSVLCIRCTQFAMIDRRGKILG